VTRFSKITLVEARLFLREPGTALAALLTPTVVLLVLGIIPALRRPDATFGNQRFIDIFCPSLIVVAIAVTGLNVLPARFATYRERGILRRLSTTPVHPAALLLAQLVISVLTALASILLLIVVGRLLFAVPVPRQLLGFGAALLLGTAALFSLGLLVAALAPTAKSASGLAVPLFLLSMFFGGVYLPRPLLPEALVRIGDYVPPGVQALQDAWTGSGPSPLHLGIMALITAVVGVLAARTFRWE
jgi:ABC-2 type transport system permease protein